MENKLYDLMEKMYIEMQEMKSDIKDLKEGQSSLESDIKDLKEGQSNLESDVKDLKEGQSRIENKLDDIEANNADRHLTIGEQIDNLSKDLNVIEIVSGKNLADIAYLKSKRKRKIK